MTLREKMSASHVDRRPFSFYKSVLGLFFPPILKLKRWLSMPRPVIPLLIALMAGISCSYLYKIPDPPVQVALTALLVLILLALIKKWRWFFYHALLFSLFLLGILEMSIYLHPHLDKGHISHFIGSEKISAEGVICENPQVSPDKTELIVCVSRILINGQYLPVSGHLLLNVRERFYPFHYGETAVSSIVMGNRARASAACRSGSPLIGAQVSPRQFMAVNPGLG